MPVTIAYPGTVGSFSALAAAEILPGAQCHGFPSFEEAARAALTGRTDYALLPAENSSAGSVSATYGILAELPLHIVGEHKKAVRHQLLALPGATLDGIREIASHPQAIAQCETFLNGLKDVRLVPSANTAVSAREVAASGDLSRAAIASLDAAEAWGLQVLCRDIQSSRRNTTRFFLLSREERPIGKPDKASVTFRVNDRVGALVQVLVSFAISGLNMTYLASRPIPDSPFEYAFATDFEGNMDREHLDAAMETARFYTNDLRLLGVYQKAPQPEA